MRTRMDGRKGRIKSTQDQCTEKRENMTSSYFSVVVVFFFFFLFSTCNDRRGICVPSTCSLLLYIELCVCVCPFTAAALCHTENIMRKKKKFVSFVLSSHHHHHHLFFSTNPSHFCTSQQRRRRRRRRHHHHHCTLPPWMEAIAYAYTRRVVLFTAKQ